MGRIIQMADALSNKIAAGEVVERPASVVKELVENAIDAGSTVIEIEAEEAGLAKIRITDNGEGIAEEDMLTAFQRHATSKIKDESDLFRIRTLGFRGEALPSIASVSKLEMVSSTGEGAGNRVVIEGGTVVACEKASSRRGTDITVTDLFYNTPARLKYLKTIHTELGNMTDVVNRLALSHPEISFRLIHNGRKLLQTNGNGDVLQVLAAIYGMGIAKQLIPLSGESLDFQISGFASIPEVNRASRNYISTILNGRFIKNYPLVRVILEGYHSLLMVGRYPIVLLDIKLDPLLIDVNVHPSKMEVRISKEKELNELVAAVIQRSFKQKTLIPTGFAPVKKEKIISEQTSLQLESQPDVIAEMPVNRAPLESDKPVYSQTIRENQSNLHLNDKAAFTNIEVPDHGEAAEPFELDRFEAESANKETAGELEQTASRVPLMYPIGQMHGTYIFAENENGLYIIDQHAAQERLNYEYFYEKLGRVENQLQELLVPITLEYSADDCYKIMEYKNELEKVGVFLEEFGGNSFIVRAHPQWFPKGEEKETIEAMIEQLLSMKKVEIKTLRDEAAKMMSCKGAIKANRHLRNDEIQVLLNNLRKASDPFTCPHGRPVIIHFSTYDMEKMFKRVL